MRHTALFVAGRPIERAGPEQPAQWVGLQNKRHHLQDLSNNGRFFFCGQVWARLGKTGTSNPKCSPADDVIDRIRVDDQVTPMTIVTME
jgi:hypothetical protein